MDKNTIIAFVLVAIVILLMPYYEQWLFPEAEQPQQTEQVVQTEDVQQPVMPVAVAKPPVDVPDRPIAPKVDNEKNIVIENDRYYICLSNLGGGTVKEFIFKNYKDPEGNLVSLIPEESGDNLGVEFTNIYQDQSHLDRVAFYSAQLESYSDFDTLTVDREFAITYEGQSEEGITVVKTFTFKPGSYDFTLDVTFSDYLKHIARLDYTLKWEDGFNITERSMADDLMYSGVYAMMGTELAQIESRKAKANEPKIMKSDGKTEWVTFRSKYFAGFIIPTSNSGIGSYLSLTKGTDSRNFDVKMTMKMSKNDYHTDSFIIGFAPMEKSQLASYGVGLEKTMNMGGAIIKPFAVAFLWLMQQLYKVIPNYGWVLIVISILIKVVTFPLTQKSYESSKKMQLLQPKIKELQKKYGNNKQALQEKTMELYKTENVSMLGGCLPLVIQMPLLWGLFIVFRTAIELRGAPFIFWMVDLSAPDALFNFPFSVPLLGTQFNILPLLMTALMFVQQKLSGTGNSAGTDQQQQQQKMMMWMMPLMMFFLFYKFPSGLNLYYLMFNLLTILQQKFIVNKVVERKFVQTHPGGNKLKKV